MPFVDYMGQGPFLKGGKGNFKPSLSNATGWGAGVLTHLFAVRCEGIVLIRLFQKHDQHVAPVISTTTTCDLVKSFSNSAVQFLRLSHYQAGTTRKFAAHICAEGNLQHRRLAVDRSDELARPIAFRPVCLRVTVAGDAGARVSSMLAASVRLRAMSRCPNSSMKILRSVVP